MSQSNNKNKTKNIGKLVEVDEILDINNNLKESISIDEDRTQYEIIFELESKLNNINDFFRNIIKEQQYNNEIIRNITEGKIYPEKISFLFYELYKYINDNPDNIDISISNNILIKKYNYFTINYFKIYILYQIEIDNTIKCFYKRNLLYSLVVNNINSAKKNFIDNHDFIKSLQFKKNYSELPIKSLFKKN